MTEPHQKPGPTPTADGPARSEDRTKARIYCVTEQRAGQRLDNLLMRELKGVPKSMIYKLIRTGQVRVNGSRCKPLQKVALGDQVRLPPVRLAPAAPKPAFDQEAMDQLRDRIIEQDGNFLAIDKPAGMAVHAGTGLNWGLIDLLRAARPDETLELVHRIDRGTSGVLLVARNRAALLHAQNELRAGEVKKRYLCLMMGRLHEQRVQVSQRLRKVGGKQSSRVIVDPDKGKNAFTEFRDLEKLGMNTFAEAIIKTGRTHQVRVHAAHIGHPLLGDGQYGGPTIHGLDRPALHCASMDIGGDHPFIAHAPLADDLRWLIEERSSRQ